MLNDNRGELRKLLLEYCDHCPPAIANGSRNAATQFKADVLAMRKLARRQSASASELHAGINKMHAYWGST